MQLIAIMIVGAMVTSLVFFPLVTIDRGGTPRGSRDVQSIHHVVITRQDVCEAYDALQAVSNVALQFDAKQRILALYYEHGGGHQVSGVTADDLVLLRNFFAGQQTHTDVYSTTFGIADCRERLEELLGLRIS